MSEQSYEGQCFCGAVTLTVKGAPEAAGYCHCASCRSWSAGPINAFMLWKPASVKITSGSSFIGVFHKTDNSHRKWCTACGGHLMTEHPDWSLIDVYAATIPGFPFTPGVHVNYAETVLRVKDGLPKLKDLPKEMGGTGEAIPE
jgi:hypothetical protein